MNTAIENVTLVDQTFCPYEPDTPEVLAEPCCNPSLLVANFFFSFFFFFFFCDAALSFRLLTAVFHSQLEKIGNNLQLLTLRCVRCLNVLKHILAILLDLSIMWMILFEVVPLVSRSFSLFLLSQEILFLNEFIFWLAGYSMGVIQCN